MLISVITPTHSPAHLSDCWESLRAQTDTAWEWILVPNGGVGTLPQDIVTDRRVRVFPATDAALQGSIGALKHFATQHAQGDLIVELDHDDMLAPDCLATLRARADCAKPQMLYSDFALVDSGLAPWAYPESAGWRTYPWRFRGHALLATKAFAPTPSNLHWLQFAPNHVRAWTRLGLEAGGGFNPARSVADDYELILKCYAADCEFVQIPQCLYVYRRHPGATTDDPATCKRIGAAQAEIANLYLESCITTWCRREELRCLHLSAFQSAETPYELLTPVPARVDDRYQFSFDGVADNSVGYVTIREYLEYLPPDAAVPLFEELYRVLAPGGCVSATAPSADFPGGYASPAYRSRWNQATFLTWCRRDYAVRAGVTTARFARLRSWDTWYSPDEYRDKLFYVRVDLAALKGQDQAGRIEI